MLKNRVSYIFLYYYFAVISGQSVDICKNIEHCESCIQEINCDWCIDSNLDAHCRLRNDTSKSCKPNMLIAPRHTMDITENKDFSNEVDNATQIRPQYVKLALRKGEKYQLPFKFKLAANYPVDLYYLMDLSKSMEPHRKKLANLGIGLAEKMKQLTTDFKLGFGSFVDKTDLPFVSTVPERLAVPCTLDGTKRNCVSPYSFKNHLPLTSDHYEFVEHVTHADISGNIDSPEGGFDAIMQAIVCKDAIQWRQKARHLLVFSTDAEYHIAGDGKLAGVIEPNPGICYQSVSDYLKYDYPSVSQINYVASENNINIIFAIVNKTEYGIPERYQRLADSIENSNFGTLDEKDDQNVINLVVDNYKRIMQNVKFTHNQLNEVDIKFSSNCNSQIVDSCQNVRVGQEIEFTATIEIRQCPQDGQKSKLISIRPEGLSESLTVELEFLCDCSCSSKTDSTYVMNSSECENNGDLVCGVCDCHPGRSGKKCQCDSLYGSSGNASDCFQNDNSLECSGVGTCVCGTCNCGYVPQHENVKATGKFCECDNVNCKPGIGRQMCSGQGTCVCKKCVCNSGFSGEVCDCDESQTNCIFPGTNTICSDHGKCVCGRCECEITDGKRYSGKYCDSCPTCPARRCEELRHCVECKVFKSGDYKDICESNCTMFQIRVVDSLDSENNDEIKKCRLPVNDTCFIHFDYFYTKDDNLIVRALDRPVCQKPPDVLAWTLGVIATILIAGLILLLIWKVFTTIHDRREYAKFENERKKLKWGTNDNPLYKGATSTFSNPVYKRGSVRLSMRKD